MAMTIVEPQVQEVLFTLTQEYGDYRTKQEYGISAFWYWYYQVKHYIYNLHSLNIRYGSQRTHKIPQWGKLTYSKYTIGKNIFVVVHKFDYSQRNFWNWLNHKSNRKPSYSVCDNCFGYMSVLYDNSQKYGILKPDGKPLIRPIFDDIINFHHSTDDYNFIHAIGFIGDRVYSIEMNGNVTLLHLSKEEYLNKKHIYENITRKIKNKEKLHKNMKNTKQTFRLTESQLHNVIKESVKQALSEGYLNGSYYDEYEYYPSEDEIEQGRREDIINGKKTQKFAEKIIRFSEKLGERYFDEGRWSNPAARVFYYTLTPSMNGLREFVKNCKEGYYF